MVQNIQQWREEEFLPWKEKMRVFLEQRENSNGSLKQQAKSMQRLVGFLLDGKVSEAVTMWNELGLKPKLAEVSLDWQQDTITLQPVTGSHIILNIDDVLADLAEILAV